MHKQGLFLIFNSGKTFIHSSSSSPHIHTHCHVNNGHCTLHWHCSCSNSSLACPARSPFGESVWSDSDFTLLLLDGYWYGLEFCRNSGKIAGLLFFVSFLSYPASDDSYLIWTSVTFTVVKRFSACCWVFIQGLNIKRITTDILWANI